MVSVTQVDSPQDARDHPEFWPTIATTKVEYPLPNPKKVSKSVSLWSVVSLLVTMFGGLMDTTIAAAPQPMLCQTTFGRRAFSMPRPTNCERIVDNHLEDVINSTIQVFHHNLLKVKQKAIHCTHRSTTEKRLTYAFKTNVEREKNTRSMPVSAKKCREMISYKTCTFGKLSGSKGFFRTYTASPAYTTRRRFHVAITTLGHTGTVS
jgi:hypothetical protein